jgi:biotin carboxylase
MIRGVSRTSSVVFVAPFYLDTTLRFLRAVAALPGVRVAVVSQEPAERLPADLRRDLDAHWRVDDALDPGQLVEACKALAARVGRVERLLGVLEQLQVPLAAAREALAAQGFPVSGMGVEAARNFRDKSRMKTVLATAGLPCARHALAAGAAEARELAHRVGFPLVAKPPAGAGAKSTVRLDSPQALEEALAMFRPSADRPLLLEQFLTGREHSFDSVFIDGRPVWHSISRYLPTPLEVLENPWIQWCVLLPREIDGPDYRDIREVGFKAVATLGMVTGLSHMEWFRLGDGRVAVSEVGARPPGAQITTLTSWAHDIDLYRAWARLMVWSEFDPPERRWAAGAAYLRGQGNGRVVAVHGLDQAQRELGELVVEAHLPKPGQPPADSYEGEGYVLLRHPETAVVERALARLVSLVRVELG